MATILGTPKVQFFKTGTVDYLSGGKLYSYDAGTTTARYTYPTIADALAATNPNTNPVVLDSRGEANVVINGATKLVLKDSSDNTIWTVDNVDQSSTDIYDANGNELIKFVAVASAVNEITVTNAIVGTAPIISASGGDTNVALKVTSKGSGTLKLDGGDTGAVDIGTVSTGAIGLKRNTAVTGNLTVSGSSTIGTTLAVGTALTVGTTLTVSGDASLLTTAAFSLLPAGCVQWFAGVSVPSGWLECDGSAVSRTTYSALFASLGTLYGTGDGSTTFNLPNQARRTLVGRGGTPSGTLGATTGSTGGEETHTLTSAEMPAHTHTITASVNNTTATSGAGVTVGNVVSSTTTGSTGSGGAHNNIQPSLVMIMIIRAF